MVVEKKSKIYFITGVNGVGKSTIIPQLRLLLNNNQYRVFDFDKRGVPDGADHTWRRNEIKYWLEEGMTNARQGISTIICGFAKKNDFQDLISSDTPEIELILLDADAETIRKRLTGRYTHDGVFDETQKVIGKPINEFIENNVYYCNIMRTECEADGCKIVNTNNSKPETVAQEVIAIISAS